MLNDGAVDARKQKYLDLLAKSLSEIDAGDPAARQAVYAGLRAANERMLVKRAVAADQAETMRRLLDESVAQCEAEQSGDTGAVAVAEEEDDIPSADPLAGPDAANDDGAERPLAGDGSVDTGRALVPVKPARSAAARPFALGFVSGIAIAAIAGGLAWSAVGGSAPVPAESAVVAAPEPEQEPEPAPPAATPAPPSASFDVAALEQRLDEARPQLETALAFLDRVRDEVERRQRNEPEALAALAEARFIPLRDFSSSLENEFPDGLPSGSGVIVRANAEAYKILWTWPLCGAAELLRPELVDLQRDATPVGCTYFGYWNEAGARM